jgi:O-antigen ligase
MVIGAGMAAAIYAVILFALGEGQTASYTQGVVRIMAVDWFYILFASALVVGLLTNRGAHGSLLLFCLAVLMSGLVVTFARDAWLSFVVAGASAVVLARRPGRNRLIVGAALAGCLVVMVPVATGSSTHILDNVSARFLSITDYEKDVSAQHRFNEWQADLAMINARPLAGNGLGATVAFYSPMYQGDQEGFWTETFYMHNSYLWLGAKTGLIGLMLFLALIIMPVVAGIGALRRMEDGRERACVVGLIAGLIAVAVSAMFASMLTSDHGTPLLAVVIGCLHLLCAGQVWAGGSAPTQGVASRRLRRDREMCSSRQL